MPASNPTDLVDLNSAMKVIFEDSIYDNTVHDSELLDQFEEDANVQVEETTGGRYIETAQYFNLPAGVRAVASGDYIPVPDGPLIRNSRVYLKKVQGVVEMLGDVMRRVRTNEGAFLNWGERALPDLVTRLNDYMDRVLLGFGAGALARVDSIDATDPDRVVVGVRDALGIDGMTGAWLQFQDGVRVVASANITGSPLRSAGPPIGSAQVIDVHDDVIFLSNAIAGLAEGDYIFTGDAVGAAVEDANDRPREFMGLLGMVDDGGVLAEFQEIPRSAHRKWQGIVIDAGTGIEPNVLTEDLLDDAEAQVHTRGGGKVNLIVTSRDAARQYWRTLRRDRRINDPRSYTGGKGGLSILLGDRELTLKVARKMPGSLTFGLQTNTFKRWQLGRWEWDDTTGSIWNRSSDATGRKDAFFAVGHLYIEMGNFAPRRNFRIDNLEPMADVTNGSGPAGSPSP